MTDDQIAALVGTPYKDGGETPAGFNCWGLLRYIQREFYNRELPAAVMGDVEGSKAMHVAALSDGTYRQIPAHLIEDGDCVLLRSGINPHVGVYLSNDGGCVLHSVEGMGVIVTPIHQLNAFGYGRRIYYRVRENDRKINPTNESVSPVD